MILPTTNSTVITITTPHQPTSQHLSPFLYHHKLYCLHCITFSGCLHFSQRLHRSITLLSTPLPSQPLVCTSSNITRQLHHDNHKERFIPSTSDWQACLNTERFSFFTMIDLTSGHHHIGICDGNHQYNVFSIKSGLYKWTVLPLNWLRPLVNSCELSSWCCHLVPGYVSSLSCKVTMYSSIVSQNWRICITRGLCWICQ